MLLEKARSRTITEAESKELTRILEEEARIAKSNGDVLGAIIILGLLAFLGALVAELFTD
jgi:hypothetical protein